MYDCSFSYRKVLRPWITIIRGIHISLFLLFSIRNGGLIYIWWCTVDGTVPHKQNRTKKSNKMYNTKEKVEVWKCSTVQYSMVWYTIGTCTSTNTCFVIICRTSDIEDRIWHQERSIMPPSVSWVLMWRRENNIIQYDTMLWLYSTVV